MKKKSNRDTISQLGITQILENQEQIMKFLSSQFIHLISQNNELLKSIIYNNSIDSCEWLKYRNFSPGWFAVDYTFLYTLFRVLEGMKPESILEFGLGESSKLIHQYANFHSEVFAVTGEHDAKWAEFFLDNMAIKYNINIKILELEDIVYKGENTLSYKNVEQEFKNNMFDLIIVDGPFGRGRKYARTQILYLAKNNLKEKFCIIVDDYNREGEKNTVKDLMALLSADGRKFIHSVYYGSKQHILICSENLKYLAIP